MDLLIYTKSRFIQHNHKKMPFLKGTHYPNLNRTGNGMAFGLEDCIQQMSFSAKINC